MGMLSKVVIASALLAAQAPTSRAEPEPTEPQPVDQDAGLQPPSAVEVSPAAEVAPTIRRAPVRDPLATTTTWGGGVRLTGLTGIGQLPGVNYGGEIAVLVRHDELFAELGFGRWKPEHTYVVTETPERVELGLNVWTVRAGWSSMKMPLRGWLLGEVGELANARAMPGVIARMMTGSTPVDRRWKAIGAGFGVAWPMTDNARLVGLIEFAVPMNSDMVTIESGAYEPDPLAARSSVGLEVGWR